MVRFDEMLDGILSTAKSAGKAVAQTTGDLVGYGKLKLQEQNLIKDIDRAYAKLGAVVYEGRMHSEDLEDIIQMAVDEITELNFQLDNLEKEMEEASEARKAESTSKDDMAEEEQDGDIWNHMPPDEETDKTTESAGTIIELPLAKHTEDDDNTPQ